MTIQSNDTEKIDFDDITKEHDLNWPQIPDHP